MDYYKEAVNYIVKRIENPTFFVFSEDIEYIEQEFSWIKNKYIVSNNRGKDSFRDMQLMSLCKHNIIANSTFSEWAAYFNRNEDKMVIYPLLYSIGCNNRTKGEEGWIVIDNT